MLSSVNMDYEYYSAILGVIGSVCSIVSIYLYFKDKNRKGSIISKKVPDKKCWYNNLQWLILSFFIFWPAALYGVARTTRLSLKKKIAIYALLLTIFFVYVFIYTALKISDAEFRRNHISHTQQIYITPKTAQTAIEMRRYFQEMADKLINEEGMPQRIKVPLTEDIVSDGLRGELERFFKVVINVSLVLRNECLAELEAIGWNDILDFNLLKEDNRLVKVEFIIDRAKKIVESYEDKHNELINEIRNGIKMIKIDYDSKQKVLMEFDYTYTDRKNRIKEIFEYEKKIIFEIESFYQILMKKDSWEIVEGQLAFNDEADLNLALSHLETAEKYYHKQQALMELSKKNIEAYLEVPK